MLKSIKVMGIVIVLIFGVFLFLGTRTASLPDNYGGLDTTLYLAEGEKQPLVVAFGGGSGGNDWERNYLKEKREGFLERGIAVLAVGYFKTEHSPNTLDRISLNAISDSILHIARRNPQLDTSRIVLMGASKGAELALNLASKFPYFKGVVALSTAHVSFPAHTLAANTSSWHFNNQEIPYVPAPFKTLWPALQGDLFGAFSMILEDEKAASKAEIEVEKINGFVLILSGKQDEQWPATSMSERLIERLSQNNFRHSFKHYAFEGGHIEPLNHFDSLFNFLERELGN